MPRHHPSSSKGRRKRREKEERALRMVSNSNSDHDNAVLSTSETEYSDNEFAQKSRSRSSSSSTSSRSSTGHKSRKEYYSSDSDSEASPLPDSFVQNKENRRVLVNSNIMGKSTSGKGKKTRTSARVQNKKDKDSDQESKNVLEMQAEIARLKRDKSNLQNRLEMAAHVEIIDKAGSVDDWTDEQKAWYKQVHGAVKKYGWNSVKFINSEQKLVQVTGKIFDKWNLKEYVGLVGNEREEAKNAWVAKNSDLVRMAFNETRNYAQARLRDFVVEQIKANRLVPTYEDVLACAKRDPAYMTDPAKQEIFDMYVDILLFHLLGKESWDTFVRHYHCPSDLIDPKDVTQGQYVRVSSEAMVVAFFKNCFKKWEYVAKCHKEDKVVDRKNKDFKVDYIESKKGQQKWGGWNDKGRKYHSDIALEINNARAQDHVKEMEQACLARLRVKHGIEERDAKKKSGKKRKRGEEEKKEEIEIDDTFDSI